MPQPASALEHEPYARVLLMGPPKCGKTTAVVSTCPSPTRVLLCEGDSALRGAKRLTSSFDFERILGWNSMSKALVEAKRDAQEKRIKSVLVDPLSDFADRLLVECFKLTETSQGKEDGRRAYPEYAKRLLHVIDALFQIPAHVFVICHYMEVGGGMDGDGEGLAKTGEGIVPLLAGKARAMVAAKFSDVIWMDVRRGKDGPERVFVTSPQGAWGPGCRSLAGNAVLPADVGVLLKAFDDASRTERQANNRQATPLRAASAARR